jgi:ribose transport system ATP-binding protein
LSQAEKVIVSIARALDDQAQLVVLDEPTASLPAYETELLHNALRVARNTGCSFILVTHRLSEVFQLCDKATVLAAGRNVFAGDLNNLSYEGLVRMVAGRAVERGKRKAPNSQPKTVRLEAQAMKGGLIQSPISFSVRAGEVLAITGLVGSGYVELAAWLSGMTKPSAGALYVDSVAVPLGDAERLRRERVGLVVGDRSIATFPHMTVLENIFTDGLGTGKKIALTERAEKQQAADTIRRFHVHPAGCSDRSILSLSGGNQQKVVFLRAIARSPKVLVLIDPTSGVDIGGRAELYGILREQLNSGVAVVLSSSDLDEVATLADEVLIMRAGRIGAHLRGAEINEERLATESHKQLLS